MKELRNILMMGVSHLLSVSSVAVATLIGSLMNFIITNIEKER